VSITFGRTLQHWCSGGFTVTETLHPAGLRLPMHDHEAANVTIVLRGGFEERVENRSFSAQRGSVIVKPAGARHANAYGTDDVECVTTEVPREVGLDEARHFTAPVFALLAERLREDADILAVQELVYRLAAPSVREPRAPWLGTVEQMVREENITSLTALAEAVGRHPAHVARQFQSRYRCSIGEFVRARRIDRARALLLETDRPLAEIALECGFCDQSHFTNVFRRLAGKTPQRYRAQRSSKTGARRDP
jgi:AraC family transcriptional regulator